MKYMRLRSFVRASRQCGAHCATLPMTLHVIIVFGKTISATPEKKAIERACDRLHIRGMRW